MKQTRSTKSEIENFLAQKTLAVVGASRGGKKFGNVAYRELRARGYRVIAVHPSASEIEGDRCYPSLDALPERVDGAVIVVPPRRTEVVVGDAARAGVPRVWMQQGAESAAAIRFCEENGIAEIHGECILMFAAPVRSIHRAHRWLRGTLRTLPA